MVSGFDEATGDAEGAFIPFDTPVIESPPVKESDPLRGRSRGWGSADLRRGILGADAGEVLTGFFDAHGFVQTLLLGELGLVIGEQLLITIIERLGVRFAANNEFGECVTVGEA